MTDSDANILKEDIPKPKMVVLVVKFVLFFHLRMMVLMAREARVQVALITGFYSHWKVPQNKRA